MKAMNEIPEAWRLAIQRERDAYDFYDRMAQGATDAGTRSLFEMLVEQEKRHEAILEAEYRKLFEPDLEMGRRCLPITWYEWDEDSFDLARSLELPVMLYITAPWCEPCHLMEQTTLADQRIVEAINAGFIPILVDADKRPDVDSRYNKGGWPTTAFLNAEGEELESHNYLTVEQGLATLSRVKARYEGKTEPAAPTIAIRLGAAWTDLEERPEAIGTLTPELVDQVALKVTQAFDREHGGLGTAPKFHHADALEFALAVAHRTGDEALAQGIHKSLTTMSQEGLYDRIGGGFFRYANTADWRAPNLEKLAEDQAQLLALYLRAYQATGELSHLDTAHGTLQYIETTLRDRVRGFFYSSQQADPAYYALDAQSRSARQAPYVDRNAYTGRNAAVASAYLLASAALNDPRYADVAIRAMEFLWSNSYFEGQGMHHYFDTAPHVAGLLADQVSMSLAWLDSFEHFGREIYLQHAETLMRFAKNALRDGDGRYFDTVAAPEAVGRLRRREKPFRENLLAAEANLRLYRLTGREEYHQLAQQTLEALVPAAADLGFEAARFALTVDRFLRKPLLITVVGENEDPVRAELLRAARRAYAPNKAVQAVDPVWEQARLARLGYPGKPAPVAYACLGTLCARPTADPNELLAQAQAMVGQERKGRARAWEYKGYTVDEGFKPEPRERFQYFFRVMKGDSRVFRYCIWTSKEAIARRWPDLDLPARTADSPGSTDAGLAKLQDRLRAEGHNRIQAKIDAGDLENRLLDLRGEDEEEEILEERNA